MNISAMTSEEILSYVTNKMMMEVAELQSRNIRQGDEIMALRHQLTVAKEQHAALDGQYTQMRDNAAEWKSKYDQLESNANRATNSALFSQDAIERLKGELATARNAQEKAEKELNKVKAERYATSKPKLLAMLEEHPGKIVYSPSRDTAFRISSRDGRFTRVNQLTGELTDGSPQIELKYFATTDWLIAEPVYKPRDVTREQALKEIKEGQLVRRKSWPAGMGITESGRALYFKGLPSGMLAQIEMIDQLLLGDEYENWEVQRIDPTDDKLLFAVDFKKGHPNGEK